MVDHHSRRISNVFGDARFLILPKFNHICPKKFPRGCGCFSAFRKLMNMPLLPENNAWYVKVVNNAASDVFAVSSHEAAINLRLKLAVIDNSLENFSEKDFSQVLDVDVFFDDTWYYRGFKFPMVLRL